MRIITFILFYAMLASGAFATGTSPSGSSSSSSSSAASSAASSSGGGSDAWGIGLGAASPSANACQATRFFGWTQDVKTCQLQQWTSILGPNPSPLQLQIACQDELLEVLPLCEKYRKPAAK